MISQMSNEVLLEKFNLAVCSERQISHLVLQFIVEIKRRKLYLDRGYPSLYSFLTGAFGYSESAAQRRIEAARLLELIPEAGPQLENGSLKMSQLVQVQQACREFEKQNLQPVSVEKKRELLKKVESSTSVQTQVIAAQTLGVTPHIIHRMQNHADSSVTITMTFSKDQMAILQEVRALESHALPNANWAEVVVHLAEKVIRQKTKISRPSPRKFAIGADRSRDHIDISENKPRSLRPNDRKELLSRRTCEFVDSKTGRKCGSMFFRQIDHRKPVSEGGGSNFENLRVLCAAHNRQVYRADRRSFRVQQKV